MFVVRGDSALCGRCYQPTGRRLPLMRLLMLRTIRAGNFFQNESAPFLVFFFCLKKKDGGAISPPLNVICVFCATLECLGNFVSEFFMFQVLNFLGGKMYLKWSLVDCI